MYRQFLDKENLSDFNKLINERYQGRLKYCNTFELNTTFTDFNVLVPAHVGDVYRAVAGTAESVIFNDIEIKAGDWFVVTNESRFDVVDPTIIKTHTNDPEADWVVGNVEIEKLASGSMPDGLNDGDALVYLNDEWKLMPNYGYRIPGDDIAESDFTFDTIISGWGKRGSFNEDTPLVLGERYAVSVDGGESQEVEAVPDSGSVALHLSGDITDVRYWEHASGGEYQVFGLESLTENTHHIKITKVDTYVPFDKRYLPEMAKAIIRVDELPTDDVTEDSFYLLTEDMDDYDAGLYYAVKDGIDIIWVKAGADDGIIYVDALPDTDVDTQVFYYLKAKVDDFELGLYYAVLKDDGTYKWHFLEESGIVAVEDEDTGIITFENGNATPYEAIIAVDELPTTNVQTDHFYRLKADVGDYEAGVYYAIKNEDGTYTWAKDGAAITDQIKIVKYFKNMDSVAATDGVSPGEYKTFEINISLEGYDPVAILNPRCMQAPYYDKTLDSDAFNDGAVMVPENVKFKLNDTTKVVGAMVNLSPKNQVWHYMTIAFDVMYFKKS